MNKAVVTVLALAAFACGPSTPATSPPVASAAPPAASAAPPAASAAPPAASASASASASTPGPVFAPASASASAKPTEVMTTSVTATPNEITTPNVVTPDKVISGLRPKFNACFADGLKRDPKTTGSVTLSAKIEKDGKVSAVTPKMLTGFSPAVVKCLSDHLKGANFAPAGGMNDTTSLDIPLSFTSDQ
jgi:hypothetical protein